MDTTMNDVMDQAREGTKQFTRDLKNGSARVKHAAGSELNNLLQDVDDLLNKVGDASGVDVTELRERVQSKMKDARGRLAAAAGQAGDMARNAASATDDFVRDRPWQAIGTAAALGAVIGFLLARR